MKKTGIITGFVVIALAWGCSDKQHSGRVYMPDMAYSRAYETYASTANLDSLGIHYDKKPVPGTIKRGSVFPFMIPVDKPGDSINYNLAKQVTNPLPALNKEQLIEAERLYLVNCGICHGMKLDGNGPLYNGGNGPYAAAPKNLMTLSLPDGQMFYSITYGKGQMGPYGPQLNTAQRWMIIDYIRAKQGKGGGAVADSALQIQNGSGSAAQKDSSAKR
ncbi:MAG TPA: c-type cytochrome [Flavitalea sp.]|nr:c-type cytochrome [Flavitalea sp.]